MRCARFSEESAKKRNELLMMVGFRRGDRGVRDGKVVGHFKGRCGAYLGSANERGPPEFARGIRRAGFANTAMDLRCGVVSPVPFETLFATAKRAKGAPLDERWDRVPPGPAAPSPDEHTC